MQKWEYRIVTFGPGGFMKAPLFDSDVKGKAANVTMLSVPERCEFLAQYLNGLGTEGWELVSAAGLDAFILKRPKS